jgi:hypothetical protein
LLWSGLLRSRLLWLFPLSLTELIELLHKELTLNSADTTPTVAISASIVRLRWLDLLLLLNWLLLVAHLAHQIGQHVASIVLWKLEITRVVIVIAHLSHLGLQILVLNWWLLRHFPLLLILLVLSLSLCLVRLGIALHLLHELSLMDIIDISASTEVLSLGVGLV